MSSTDSLHEAQMLHPMTLVQRFLLSLPAFVLLLFPMLRSPNSADYFPLLAVFLYGVLALPLIFLRYFRFRYSITPKEITIQSGIFNRQHRSIPIERIQNIEIEQSVLPRMLGTAKVKIETAGSSKTEGVLEFVSIGRAYQIREVVRTYQREQSVPAGESQTAEALHRQEALAPEGRVERDYSNEQPLFALSLSRVILAGMLRFSLLYIAIAFSLIQQLNPDPDEIELWLTRGWLRPVAELAQNSPWMLTFGAVIGAVTLSWLTGILVSLNSNYNFKLWLEGDKLHKHQGLLTVFQGTIPLKRIQTLIYRANVLMRRFGWTVLDVQTMGLESSQRGHQTAIPLARVGEAQEVARQLLPHTLPASFHSVSPLTIRRTILRFTMLLTFLVLPISYFWKPALWGFLIVPLIPVYAILRYRNHGYALDADNLYVRRGVFRQYTWVIPVSKFQVLYTTASLFQRRLGLRSVYVDTAGAGGLASPEIIDVTADDAEQIIDECYARFQSAFAPVAPS